MTLNFTFYQFAERSNEVGEKKKYHKQTFFRIMVPTQELIKTHQSLLRVICSTTLACENVWTTTSPLFHVVQFFK